MGRKRIGDVLLERGALSSAQLAEGLSLHRATRQRLGKVLVQRGTVSEEQVSDALSTILGVPRVDLSKVSPAREAMRLLRPRFCEEREVFPYAFDLSRPRKQLLVAMTDPQNLPLIEELEFMTGSAVAARVTTLADLRAAVMRHYYGIATEGEDSGKMTLLQRGGGTREVDTGTPHPEPTPTRSPPRPASQISRDLDFLFSLDKSQVGRNAPQAKVDALVRLLVDKGLITEAELNAELGKPR